MDASFARIAPGTDLGKDPIHVIWRQDCGWIELQHLHPFIFPHISQGHHLSRRHRERGSSIGVRVLANSWKRGFAVNQNEDVVFFSMPNRKDAPKATAPEKIKGKSVALNTGNGSPLEIVLKELGIQLDSDVMDLVTP